VVWGLWKLRAGVEEKSHTEKGELKAVKRKPKSKSSAVDGGAPGFCVSGCEA